MKRVRVSFMLDLLQRGHLAEIPLPWEVAGPRLGWLIPN